MVNFFCFSSIICVFLLNSCKISALNSCEDSIRTYDGPLRETTYNIREYGAVGDGEVLNTKVFNDILTKVEISNKSALVVVPEGKWLIAPFNLTSHLTIYLCENAVLLGTTDENLWPIVPALPSYGQGRDHVGPRRSSLLQGSGVSDVVVTGNNGTVDAQGHLGWWQRHYDGSEGNVTRGHLLEFISSTHLIISNVTLKNSPFWTVHPFNCQHVRVSFVTILSPPGWHAPNIDGVDPDSSQDVLIEDSYFRIGDDGVAIKSGWDCWGNQFGSPSRDIVIRRLTVDSPTAAGVCIGSEMSGGVRNVTVQDCHFVNVHAGIRIKTNSHRGGTVEQIRYSNIAVENAEVGIQINAFYGSPNPSCGPETWQTPILRHITVERLRGVGVQLAADLEGLPHSPITGLVFQDIYIEGDKGFKCNPYLQGSAVNVFPEPCDLELKDEPALSSAKEIKENDEKFHQV